MHPNRISRLRAPRLLALGLGGLVALWSLTAAAPARALSVSPSTVNIRANGPSTVFLTYRGLMIGEKNELLPVEAFWCGELNPDNSCAPATIFGRLPLHNELTTTSGADSFTEVVTFPASVARLAYQRARGGGPSRFFYVRHFHGKTLAGVPVDRFVPVLVRLTRGGAGVPLSLIDVRLKWKVEKPVLAIARGAAPPPFGAEIRYNGSGRLKGRWELVVPGDSQPRTIDLIPEADLPVEDRIMQRRYTRIGRFDRILPPTGKLYLPGPDPKKIPITSDGLHLILLRIEATQDMAGASSVTAGNVPGGTPLTGGTAGFPLPVLRFIVGSAADPALMANLTAGELTLVAPRDRAKIEAAEPLNFSWNEAEGALVYKLIVEQDGDEVLSAMVNPGAASYTAPPSLRDHAGEKLRWRVEALGNEGVPIATSDWRALWVEK